LARFESAVEQQIRAAQERGEFDNLPGAGEPLPGRGRPDDDLWWVRQYVRREGISTEALLPTPLRLAREIERLPEAVGSLDSEVRAAVRDLNRRIAEHLAVPSGPRVPVRPVNPDAVVEQWRTVRRPGLGEPALEHPAPSAPPGKRRRWRRR
jgi:hypothetical protein